MVMATFYSKRNCSILKDYITSSDTQTNIGKKYNITAARVSFIICKFFRILLNPKRLNGDNVPIEINVYDYRSNLFRDYKNFWLYQLDKFEKSNALI